MAYTRPCNRCGQRISMREMPHGQWVPFDVSTEILHKCHTKNPPDPEIEKLAKKNKLKKEDKESFDIGYENDDEIEIEDVKETKTYDDLVTIKRTINKAIKEKRRVDIVYQSYGGEITSRQISPVKKFKYKSVDHLQAYCHLRRAERNFKIASISEANLTNKKILKSKKIGKPKLEKYIEDRKIKKQSSINIYKDDLTPKKTYQKPSYSGSNFLGNLWQLIVAIFWIGLVAIWLLDSCS